MLEIKQAVFLTSAAHKSQWPNDNIVEFCFVGRSNVGKSTLLNILTNQKKLARTSQTPGKTRLLNFFSINQNQFRIVDIPGYGYAQVNKTQKQQFQAMIETYLHERPNLRIIYLLLDFRHQPSPDDMIMFDYLQRKNYQVVLIATKVDKVSRNHYQKHQKLLLQTLQLPDSTPIILFSSQTKVGRTAIINTFAMALSGEE